MVRLVLTLAYGRHASSLSGFLRGGTADHDSIFLPGNTEMEAQTHVQ